MKAYVIEREALSGNIRKLKAAAGDAAVYGVIKGDGYGLGLERMARYLSENGVNRFAVTELEEVRRLRDAGYLQEEILMLRATCLPEELSVLLALDAVATVGSQECALAMAQVASAAGKRFRCHLKADTGMGRYGFRPEEPDAAAAVWAMEELEVCGIYTHFHSAFCSEQATRRQYAAFVGLCDALEAKGLQLGTRHCCNSSAFLQYPEMRMDAVRLGSALLGRLAFPDGLGLQKIGWCSAQVELVRQLKPGDTVGYGAGWTASRNTTIAVCGVGYYHGFGTAYADDLFRFRDCVRGGLHYVKAFLQKKAIYIQVNGKPARVLGHIGMVQTICDVTDIPCTPGDPIRIEINPLMLKYLPFDER